MYGDGVRGCLSCSQDLGVKINKNGTQCECMEGYEMNLESLACKVVNKSGQNLSSMQVSSSIQSGSSVSSGAQQIYTQPIIRSQKNNIVSSNGSNRFQTIRVTSNLNLLNPIPSLKLSNSCVSEIPNSYFDGIECYCKIGYKNISNTCIRTTEVVFY